MGTKLRIARIPISVLPLFSFLLPLGTLSVALPFFEEKFSLNAITIVMNILNFDIGGIFKAPSSAIIGDAALMFMLSLLFVVLSALSLLVSLVFLLLNFKKFNSLGLCLTNFVASAMMFASAFCFNNLSGMMEASTFADAVSCAPSWGIFVSGALFLASSVTNFLVSRQKVILPEDDKKEETEEKETVNA